MHRNRHLAFSSTTAAAFLCVVLCGPLQASARADTPSSAKDLYTAGRVSYNLSHYEDALKQFEAAYRLKQDPAFLFNIAQCMRNLKRYEDAARTYRAYIREAPGIDTSGREQVQKLIAEMDKDAELNRKNQAPASRETTPSGSETSATQNNSSVTPKAAVASPAGASLTVVAADKPEHRSTPAYKRWWVWTIVGVVVVGAGVGIGLGVTQSKSSSNNLPGVTF
jgi:hypothetical protein